MGLASFLGRLFGTSGNTSSSRRTSRRPKLDPINPPRGLVSFVEKLYENRGRNPALGLAIASKVDAWRLLYLMGSPMGIPEDFRQHIINAENETEAIQKIGSYCAIQNVIFRNFTDPNEVRRL